MQHMLSQQQIFEAKLIRFEQIWLDLGDIWANLNSKFGWNLGRFD